MRQQPCPTAYAVRQAVCVGTIQLFLKPRITGIILQMPSKEGERVCGKYWKICAEEVNAYFSILFLAGV